MALKEKLASLSKNIEETKAAEEKSVQEKQLEPVRARIKELEKEKHQLDLVKGSLSLRSDANSGQGKGMKEYSTDTESTIQKESTQLDALVKENKEALDTLGVEDRDQLAEHSEFAEDAEVVSYKKAKAAGEGVKISDAALQKKLQGLGVSADAENFSYDTAEKAVAEKLQTVEKELVQEKLKTPEGRAEAVEMVAKGLEKSVPPMGLKASEGALSLSLDRDQTMTFSNNSVRFENWRRNNLLPKSIAEYKTAYGENVAFDALKKAYGTQIESAFENFDKKAENIGGWREALKRADPQKSKDTYKAFEEFNTIARTFSEQAQSKIAQLEERGIKQTGRGDIFDAIKSLSQLTDYPENDQKLKKDIENSHVFPPVFDWELLKEKIEKRTEQNRKFLDLLDACDSQEKYDHFMQWESRSNVPREENTIGKIYQDLIHQNKFYYGPQGLGAYDKMKGAVDPGFEYPQGQWDSLLSKKFTSYSEAAGYLEQKTKELDGAKAKMQEKLFTVLEAQNKEKELLQVMEKERFSIGGGIRDIEYAVKAIEDNKKSAMDTLSEVTKLESQLPQGKNLVLKGREVLVTSVGEQLAKLKEDIEIEKQKVRTLRAEAAEHESRKPALFGKDAWQKKVDAFKAKEREMESKISKMGNEEFTALYKKYSFKLPALQYSSLESVVNNQNSQGTSKEIFDNLRGQLQEIMDKKAPEAVMKLYKEYKDLEKQLA